MTTRDPRSRVPARPPSREGAREPTQSLQLDISGDDAQVDRDSHPSLAMGTSDVGHNERTKIESPNGRNKTPVPARPKDATKPPPTPARSPDDPEVKLGSVLGTYKLHELLGKGGMGYVYRAEHVKLGREVALKLLRGDYARRRDAVLRFFQEAKTVNRVRHRNIVDVTDFVELDDGTTFIIMEFLRGQSLGRWARTGIDLPRALAVLVQICDGLGAAHAVGVVHRDLKPDNVIVVPTSDGAEMVKLLDFGVAKLVNRDDEDVGFQTAAGSVIGTPAYMSPEQAGGMVVDHRSDIYSLGAIMYEMFCGTPMFRGRSFGEYVRKHLTEMPVPPRQTQGGAGMDDRLEALILKSLAKDPNERFSHILELRDSLLHLLGGIETHPPAYGHLAQSAVRPPMTTQLPAHLLPLPAPGMVTTVPTPPHLSSSPVPQLSQSQVYGGYSQQVPPEPQPAPTPWWVWFVGGMVAVGLGVTAAVWYANRGPEIAPIASHPAPAPASAAANEPPPPIAPAPKLVELTFTSTPSAASVFEQGSTQEKCKTPCTLNVDRAAGPQSRTFVLELAGFQQQSVVVDLDGTQHVFSPTLTRIPTVTDTPPPVTDTAQTDDTTDEPDPADRTPAPGKKRIQRKRKPTATEAKTETKTDAKIETKTDTPPAGDGSAAPIKHDDNLEPIEHKKPDEKIDPTDTHDPFHRHK